MRKKLILASLMLVVATVPFLMAIDVPTEGTELSTPYGRWLTVGSFVSAGAEPVDLIKSERTYKIILALIDTAADGEEKIILKTLKYGSTLKRFRLEGLTEDDVVVLQVYAGSLGDALDCVFVKRGTLTFTIGGQVSTTPDYEMADTLVITNDGASTTGWTVANPADDTCAEAVLDLQGAEILCIDPTTIPSDCTLLMKDY